MSTGHPCEGRIHADIHLEKADGQPFTVSDPDSVLYPVRVTEIFAKVVGTGWSTRPGTTERSATSCTIAGGPR